MVSDRDGKSVSHGEEMAFRSVMMRVERQLDRLRGMGQTLYTPVMVYQTPFYMTMGRVPVQATLLGIGGCKARLGVLWVGSGGV